MCDESCDDDDELLMKGINVKRNDFDQWLAMACVFPAKALLVLGNAWVNAAIAARGNEM
ncbi:hypothetical protein RhiirC2_797870 [Rhizophagus irregularis]|uniref:Uncharacterized protein n=1 Tax=Rhizophagus irregularis TaxID=588596 RepID=A0A2N1M7C8_9GLOM|nr:hypothetical protein RhiirC2_797870 [Rhizophagus irregularis]